MITRCGRLERLLLWRGRADLRRGYSKKPLHSLGVKTHRQRQQSPQRSGGLAGRAGPRVFPGI